jgi:diguanylate cyclase (GGDEF)-like protein
MKIKILLSFSAVIFSVTTVVISYNIFQDTKEYKSEEAEASKNVQFIYDETIGDVVHFYTFRAMSNIKSYGILDSFKTRDHDRLYALTLARWKTLQQENPSLVVMQFHMPDGTSLLRMHQPDVYGDAIATQRSMVANIHKNHKEIHGFEEGRQGLALRILIPIFDENIYIGAVEFGILSPYISEKINRYLGYETFFFIKQEKLGIFAPLNHAMTFGNFVGVDTQPKQLPLLKAYKSEHSTLEKGVLHFNNKTFSISTLPISNYDNQTIGAIMFAQSIPDFNAHLFDMILNSLFITFILILFLWLITSRIYDAITQKMKFEEMFSQSILNAMPSPVLVTDGEELLSANQKFLDYFGYKTIEGFMREHKCVCDYFEEGDTDEYIMPTKNDKRWTEYIMHTPQLIHKAKITINNKTTIFHVKLSHIEFDNRSRFVVVFSDISSMQSISTIDQLTGVANRLHFTMVYAHALKMAQREQKPLSIIFLDIDFFKKVNDVYGHIVGDSVLKHIANMTQNKIRKSDIIARWGGEEFVILLPNTSADEAYHIAEALRSMVELEVFTTVEKMTCSFGVAMLHKDETAQDLVKRVDALLYLAKENGRNKVIRE